MTYLRSLAEPAFEPGSSILYGGPQSARLPPSCANAPSDLTTSSLRLSSAQLRVLNGFTEPLCSPRVQAAGKAQYNHATSTLKVAVQLHAILIGLFHAQGI